MIPFRVAFHPGESLYEQVVCAVKRAVVSGQMRRGDPFPSVRALGKELKINPNTAHKVVTQLIGEGLLEVKVGVGTVVAALPPSTANERSRLLKPFIPDCHPFRQLLNFRYMTDGSEVFRTEFAGIRARNYGAAAVAREECRSGSPSTGRHRD